MLTNNFPCISTFPHARLKIVAMAYIRAIPNTIQPLFQYLALLYQYHSFSQVFSAFLPGICVAFCLIYPMLAAINKSGNIIFSQTILTCLQPFCPRGMVTSSWTIQFKGLSVQCTTALSKTLSLFHWYVSKSSS